MITIYDIMSITCKHLTNLHQIDTQTYIKYRRILAFYSRLANTRSLLNEKTYILIFPIKPERDFKRLSSPRFGPIESEIMLLEI